MQMKTVFQIGLVVSAMTGLAGCGSVQNYAKKVDVWQGRSEQELVRGWGHPAEVNTLSNGDDQYIYFSNERESMPPVYSPTMTTRLSPQENNTLSRPAAVKRDNPSFVCETVFEINHAGTIVKTSFDGDDCVASSTGHKIR